MEAMLAFAVAGGWFGRAPLFLCLFLVLVWGWVLFVRNRTVDRLPYRAAGIALLLVSSSMLLGFNDAQGSGGYGGIIGEWVARGAAALDLGGVAVFLLLLATLASLPLATDWFFVPLILQRMRGNTPALVGHPVRGTAGGYQLVGAFAHESKEDIAAAVASPAALAVDEDEEDAKDAEDAEDAEPEFGVVEHDVLPDDGPPTYEPRTASPPRAEDAASRDADVVPPPALVPAPASHTPWYARSRRRQRDVELADPVALPALPGSRPEPRPAPAVARIQVTGVPIAEELDAGELDAAEGDAAAPAIEVAPPAPPAPSLFDDTAGNADAAAIAREPVEAELEEEVDEAEASVAEAATFEVGDDALEVEEGFGATADDADEEDEDEEEEEDFEDDGIDLDADPSEDADAATSEIVRGEEFAPAPVAEAPPLRPDDELFVKAGNLVVDAGRASISSLQRGLGVGYFQAAKLLDRLERDGVIGPYSGGVDRKLALTAADWARRKADLGG